MKIYAYLKSRLKEYYTYISSSNLFENYLPIFRVYISFHILKKIYLNWGSTDLFLDKTIYTSKYSTLLPLIESRLFNDTPVINIITIVLAILYAFGIGKNITALLLFFSALLYFEPFLFIANGGDNLLYFIMIYMIFVNSYKHLNIFNNYGTGEVSNVLSNLATLSIMLHLCLAYFVSGVHKMSAGVWFNGVATYYVWQLERFNAPINYLFYKNAFIIGFSTYFTILFELLFPFLIWIRQFRKILLISGLVLHLGIYFTMMIYDFEILFIAIYGFWISDATWGKLFLKINPGTLTAAK